MVALISLGLLLNSAQGTTIGPNLTAGHKVRPFVARDRSGKIIHFPRDFKGKVVMLDFWSTQCVPCMHEVPNIASVYRAEHEHGFAVLGISLNDKESIKTLSSNIKKSGMTWDQIADDKYWESKIVKLYGVTEIPQAFLVDGSTGKIIAQGNDIRGKSLRPAVQKALAAHINHSK